MSQIPNPYFAGPPATQPDTFFGRQDVLRFVDDTLASPMHNVIVFHGQRRIGKTSILHQTARRSGQDFQAVFFDLQSSVAGPGDDLFYGLAREVAARVNVAPPKRAEFEGDPDAFRTSFLPRVYDHLEDRRLLLLLDEFDALSLETTTTELDALPFVQALNRIIQSDDKRIVFFFVVGRRLKDLSSQQLQIFRGARDRQIMLLDQKSTEQLIIQPAQGILAYEDGAVAEIWSLTSGHPYFTQLICHQIFSRAHRQNDWTVTKADVEAVIEDAINSGQSALQWFWDEVSPVERFTLYTIGHLAAEWGGVTLDQLMAQRNARGVQVPDFELRALPDQLVDREVLRRDAEQRYTIAVELARRWIVRSHSHEEVTTELTRAAVDEPAKTFFKAGLAAYREDDIDFALENFSRALNINPDYVEARLWLARARAKTGDLLAAIDEFTYVERFGGPEKRDARLGLADVRARYGQQLEAQGKIEEAIQEYERAVTLDSQHLVANNRLSDIYCQEAERRLLKGGIEAAWPLYDQALQHSLDTQFEHDITERLDQYAQEQAAAKNWTEAEQASHRVAEIMARTDNNQEALLHAQLSWARWHLDQQELETAATVYRRLMQETASKGSHRVIENDILRYSQDREEENNWPQAEMALSLLVELFPDELEHRGRLADSLCRQAEYHLDHDNLAEAKVAYQRVLEEAPGDEALRAQIRTGFQLYRQVRSEQSTPQARKSVEQAIQALVEILGQDDVVAYRWLAEARQDLGDALRAEGHLVEARSVYEAAVDDATHVLQLATESEAAYQQRATICLKLGQLNLDEARFDQAQEHFSQALTDTSFNATVVDQIKAIANDYRHRQEEQLRWNQATRAMELLDRMFPEDEAIQFWLAETQVEQANWHLSRAIPDLEAARRLARSALLERHLSYIQGNVIAGKLKDAFRAYCVQQEKAAAPNWAQTEQAMNSLVGLLPDDAEVHRWLAETRLQQADWYLVYECQSAVEARRYLHKAAEVCRRALNDLPDDEAVMTHLKESFATYIRQQQTLEPPNWPLVEQALELLADLLPGDEQVRQRLAETYLSQGGWLLQQQPDEPAEAKALLAEAGQVYAKALQLDPDDRQVLEETIQAQFKAYRHERAQVGSAHWELVIEAMSILAGLLPKATATQEQQAEVYAAQGDWLLAQDPVDLDEVERVYRQALAERPGSSDLLATRIQQNVRSYRLKQQQVDPPDWAAAARALTTLAGLLPDDDETRWQQAELYAEQGQWFLRQEAADPGQARAALEEAGSAYRQALAAEPDVQSALIEQIKADFNAYRQKQLRAVPPHWDLAERAAQTLIELPLEDDDIRRQLAEVRVARARAYLQADFDPAGGGEQGLDRAAAIYRQTLSELPDQQAFLCGVIKEDLNHYRLKRQQATPPDWSRATHALTLMADLFPEEAGIQGWLAELYLAQGRFYEDEARSLGGWRQGTQQSDKFDQAERHYKQAVAAAQRWVKLAPGEAEAWRYSAIAHFNLGRIYRLIQAEQEALTAYGEAVKSWRKVSELDLDDAYRQEMANAHVARGDLRLQQGDLMAAGKDYLKASELTGEDQPWVGEVDQQLQTYQVRQKSLEIQKQVVAAADLRHQLQPTSPSVWHEFATELVAHGNQFLEDNEFDLARQRYERAMDPPPELTNLNQDEHARLCQVIARDVTRFIERQDRANNRRLADEARNWLIAAGLLDRKKVPSVRRFRRRSRYSRRAIVVAVAVAVLLCSGGTLVYGMYGKGPLAPLVAMIVPSTATQTPTPSPTPTSNLAENEEPVALALSATVTNTPTATNTPSPSPTATDTPPPTETFSPTPADTITPTPTPSTPTATPSPSPTPNLVPQLVGPENNAMFRGASPLPRLEWEPVEGLGPDERYVVMLSSLEDNQLSPYPRQWFNGTFWEVPIDIFHQAEPPTNSLKRGFQWQVVLAQVSDGRIIRELGEPSETRTFTWEPIPLPDSEGLDVTIDPQDNRLLLVVLRGLGIFKSDNGGIDWRQVSNKRTVETLHIASVNNKVVYAGAFAQVLRSTNSGETWQAWSIPPTAQIYDITTDPDNPNLVFAATDRGIVRSGDGGQTWLTLDRAGNNGGLVLNGRFYSVVTTKTSFGNRVYAAGEGNQIYWRGTDDTNAPWQAQVCNACAPPIFALAVDPKTSTKLLAGSDKAVMTISSNAGNNWDPVTIPPAVPTLKFSVLKFDPTDPQIVYAGSGTNRNPLDGQGLYGSLDGGRTWHGFNNPPLSDRPGTYIQGIALDPTDSQTIFIAGSQGVFRSDDGGDNWLKQ